MKRMNTPAKQNNIRVVLYWIATGFVTAELFLGGTWDILQIPLVSRIFAHLGYPSYCLIILGIWKVLGGVALLVPRYPRVKEWAYAGVIFNYTGAIASFLAVGGGFSDIFYPIIQICLAIVSWALRPSSRSNLTSKNDLLRI